MELKFNVTGSERKALVEAISEITGEKAKYMGMPTAAYQVAEFTIGKDGTVFTGKTTESMVELMVERLSERGFEVELQKEEMTGTIIQMPLSMFDENQLHNLQQLIDAKGTLLKKAIGVTELPINVVGNKVEFPWFPLAKEPAEIKAYMHLITALCEMACRQKRITAKEKIVENEKYAFRCFLLRLGFIGTEYKEERKILLQNLSGSAAFKNGGAENEISK